MYYGIWHQGRISFPFSSHSPSLVSLSIIIAPLSHCSRSQFSPTTPRIVQSIPCYDFSHPHLSSFYITTAQLVGYISTSTLYPLPFTLHLLRTLHPTPPDYDYCNYYIGGFFSESYHSFIPPSSFSSPKWQSLLLDPYTIIFCNAFVQLFRLIPPVNGPFFAIIHFITSFKPNP